MVLRRPPERVRIGDIREVHHDELRPLRTAALAPYPWATSAVIEHLLAREGRDRRTRAHRCFAAFVEGDLAAYIDLYLGDGSAQIEDVATVERHRNKGLASAVV